MMEDPHRSDLFVFDAATLQDDILLRHGPSDLRYQEYAVFARDDGESASTTPTPSEPGDADHDHDHDHDHDRDRPFLRHTAQCIASGDGAGDGDALFRQAVRDDHAVGADGAWGPRAAAARGRHHHQQHHHQHQHQHPPAQLQGRVRVVTCRRRPDARTTDHLDLDGLHLAAGDYAAMGLHPATLQYVRRRAVESMFWDRHHERLALVLSFPADPRAPFDFLSLLYSVADRTTTLLVRESPDPARRGPGPGDGPGAAADVAAAGYDRRMQACRAHWAHPLVTPVVLLQVQFARTERAVAENHSEVIQVERDVGNLAGFDAYDGPEGGRRGTWTGTGTGSGSGSPAEAGMGMGGGGGGGGGMGMGMGPGQGSALGRRGSQQQPAVVKKSTELMKNAHDVLKNSIRLLDTLNWMERAIKILLDAGDQLDDVRQGNEAPAPSSAHAAFPVPLAAKGRVGTGLLKARIVDDPLAGHWHEIKQYLEGLQQLCLSLKTDRKILEMRCNALVDIIYSKMAQEDNNLNARMAVASSRDSSSMKALAVITAVFLPGEFMSSLFGMGIFNWDGDGDGAGGGGDDAGAVVGYDFWVYWAITIPVTILILVLWRAWWVGQDRYFRRHLSKDLSEERYWTDDRRPRALETSFLWDFLYMSVRKGEAASDGYLEPGPSGMFPSSTGTTDASHPGDEATRLQWLRLKWSRKSGEKDGGLASPARASRLRQTAFEDVDPSRRSPGIV